MREQSKQTCFWCDESNKSKISVSSDFISNQKKNLSSEAFLLGITKFRHSSIIDQKKKIFDFNRVAVSIQEFMLHSIQTENNNVHKTYSSTAAGFLSLSTLVHFTEVESIQPDRCKGGQRVQPGQTKDKQMTGQTKIPLVLGCAGWAHSHRTDCREINSFLHHKQMNYSGVDLCCWKILCWKKNGVLEL